ncbi:putative tetratricopeptide-like helical domain superfamily [Helianthus annuus]|nr:putative tetratricopeptide-like helical domain superfamily [Helianthus annuus]
MDIHTYNTLIRGLCKTGRLVSARELINEMTLKGCKPNTVTYTILIDGHCKEQRLEEAGEIMREMSKNGLCKMGKVQRAFDFLKDMVHLGIQLMKNSVDSYMTVDILVCRLKSIKAKNSEYRCSIEESPKIMCRFCI